MYEYKVHGVMPDLDPEESARVYVDWEYRKIWDTYVLGKCVSCGLYISVATSSSCQH